MISAGNIVIPLIMIFFDSKIFCLDYFSYFGGQCQNLIIPKNNLNDKIKISLKCFGNNSTKFILAQQW